MVDKLEKQRLAASYGFAMAFLNSDPELWKLFNKAVKNTWAPEMFVARLRDTKWFKKHSANVRNAIMQETADPATYKVNVDKMYSTVRDSWGKMFGDQGTDSKQLRAWAETAHRMGWSESQLIDRMSKGIDYQKLLHQKTLGGSASEARASIEQLMEAYGVNFGDKWKAARLHDVMNGDDSLAGIQSRVRDQAKREYAAWADQIDGGATVAELADPYRQKMAELLELNPNDVNLHDQTIQNAMKTKDSSGRPAALSMTDFADNVRKDRRWQYTDNARQQVSSVTEGLLRSFGLSA